MVVEGGRILDVGPGLDGDELIDCSGRSLLPGLFDCHVHVMSTTIDVLANLATPFSYRFYQAAANLAATLALGITTVRDAGGADLGVKQAAADGLIAAPRMQVALTILSQTGGHGDTWQPCGGALPGSFVPHPGRPSNIVDGPDEVRRKVRQLVQMGADVIKVCTSGGVLSARDDPRHAHFRDDELEVLVTEATAAHRPVMAHAQANEGIKAAVRTGVRSIEHGIYLDDEAIEMMLDRGTWLVPTLLAPQGVLAAAAAGLALTQAAKRKAAEVVDVHVDSFRRAVDAGVKVAMGTDCPVSPHGTNLDELDLMERCSAMAPTDALVAATSSAAALLGLDDELGTVEPGKRADLVVVAGDPLDLPGLAKRVEQVWKDGQQVVPLGPPAGPVTTRL